jgi:RNA-splicing ligase RtcB
MIIRKGSIRSVDELIVIPLNMRDGALLCSGLSNSDWNYSAPHGSGRLYSRSKAKEMVDINKYRETMKGIYTTSVSPSTLDESPFCYKDTKFIEDAITPTATIIERLKPILNIKDTGKSQSWKEKKADKKKADLEREAQRRMKKFQ